MGYYVIVFLVGIFVGVILTIHQLKDRIIANEHLLREARRATELEGP